MAAKAAGELRAGVAARDITPPVGIDLSGGAFGPSRGVLHPLEAKALVLEGGGARLVLVVCDLLGFDPAFAREIREEIAGACGVALGAVMLTATHTHCGPATLTLRNWGAPDEGYRSRLRRTLVEAAVAAAGALRPARVGAGAIACPGVAVNRALGDEGATDDRLVLVRIDTAGGEPLAVIVSFACHPVNLHGSGLVTPDFPYYVQAGIREGLGSDVPVLYLSGAGGDLNPTNFKVTPGEAGAAETGGRVAAKALELFPAVATRRAAGLAFAAADVAVPLQPLPSRAQLRKVIEERRRRMEAEADPSATHWEWCSHKTNVEWAEEALVALDGGEIRRSQTVGLAAFRVGEAAVLGVPGEPFAELGVAVGRCEAFEHALVASNANGSVGYFPSRRAYEVGTYEATGCPKFIGLYFFEAGVGERVMEAGLELLRELGRADRERGDGR